MDELEQIGSMYAQAARAFGSATDRGSGASCTSSAVALTYCSA